VTFSPAPHRNYPQAYGLGFDGPLGRIMAAMCHHHASSTLASPVCPEPSAFTFVICTITAVAWIFLQICWSYSTTLQSTPVDKADRTANSISKRLAMSFFYLAVSGILLLDGCWLITIFSLGIKQLLTATTHGMIDYAFTMIMGAFYVVILLGLVVLWIWTMRRIMEHVLDL
jgi:hypothetical protein